MRYIMTCIALLLALTASPSKAAGPYDGIYTAVYGNTLIGYVTLHENNGVILGGLLHLSGLWEAYMGARNGNTGTISSITNVVAAQFYVTLASDGTYTATQLSCTPIYYQCDLPNGAIVTGYKIW